MTIQRPLRFARVEWGLATSACVLATILVMLCIGQPIDQVARAGESVTPGPNGIGVIALTNGEGPDNRQTENVYLLDNRNELLMIYGVDTTGNNRTLTLRTVESLPNLFRAARTR